MDHEVEGQYESGRQQQPDGQRETDGHQEPNGSFHSIQATGQSRNVNGNIYDTSQSGHRFESITGTVHSKYHRGDKFKWNDAIARKEYKLKIILVTVGAILALYQHQHQYHFGCLSLNGMPAISKFKACTRKE